MKLDSLPLLIYYELLIQVSSSASQITISQGPGFFDYLVAGLLVNLGVSLSLKAEEVGHVLAQPKIFL